VSSSNQGLLREGESGQAQAQAQAQASQGKARKNRGPNGAGENFAVKPRFIDFSQLNPLPERDLEPVVIRFDGGYSKSTGGYGSYRWNNGEVFRITHPPEILTANQAEIATFIYAVEHMAIEHFGDKSEPAYKVRERKDKCRLCVYGDSQIALKWIFNAGNDVEMKEHPKYHWDPAFRKVLLRLYKTVAGFRQVAVKWEPRSRNVQIFGH
jgi:ribonuclease HI